MRACLLMIGLALIFQGQSFAKTITAIGGTSAAVQSAIDSASPGDTVQIPDGNYTWGSQVNVSKAVVLEAQTKGGVNLTHGGASAYLISIVAAGTGHFILAGINFLPGTAGNNQNYLRFTGNGPAPLMHDCSFNVPNFQLLHAIDWECSGGVIWHCHFFSLYRSSSAGPGSGSGVLRHLSQVPWLDASTYGTLDTTGEKNLYIEDCAVDNLYNQWYDADDNARAVIRHCVLTNSQGLTHGSTGKTGGRQIELYQNQFKYAKVDGMYAPLNRWFWWRAGTARVWGNSVDQINSGGYWGGPKASWVFIAESLTRGGQVGCQKASDYPNGWHWPGFGADGTKQISDPVYIWDNTGGGASSWGTNDQSGDTQDCFGGGTTADVFKLNRDIFLHAPPAGTYTAYPYPHPLRGGEPEPTPQPTATPVPIPSPTPAPTATPEPPRPTPTPTQTWEKWMENLNDWIRANPPYPDQR